MGLCIVWLGREKGIIKKERKKKEKEKEKTTKKKKKRKDKSKKKFRKREWGIDKQNKKIMKGESKEGEARTVYAVLAPPL
jgi:hypothetical protein